LIHFYKRKFNMAPSVVFNSVLKLFHKQ